MTTPTRDEAVPAGWKLVPVEPTEAMMAIGRTCGTNSANTYAAMLASAPAPASGRVDAVLNLYREAVRIDVKMEGPQFMGANSSALKRAWEADRASLASDATPAPTSGSEDGGEAVPLEKYRTAVLSRERTILEMHDKSEAVIAGLNKQLTEQFDLTTKLAARLDAALAKPASSPAPVRPIGNQGISDYQREIARNMAEGFAAWNAARQEALPSDEPASSPAGGDVVEALKRIAEHPEKYDDGVQSYDVGFAFWNVQKIARNALAALSQSTSADKPTEKETP